MYNLPIFIPTDRLRYDFNPASPTANYTIIYGMGRPSSIQLFRPGGNEDENNYLNDVCRAFRVMNDHCTTYCTTQNVSLVGCGLDVMTDISVGLVDIARTWDKLRFTKSYGVD